MSTEFEHLVSSWM